MTKTTDIILNAFLRRCLKAYALKQLIRNAGGQLHRIGRSRNWRLIASQQQLRAIIEQIRTSDEKSWQWLAEHLQKFIEQLSYQQILALAKQKPEITVNELMALTDCTISQARTILDELEELD